MKTINLVNIIIYLSKPNNLIQKVCIEKSCERCWRVTNDLSFTNVLVCDYTMRGPVYDLMQICSRGCLTICTHCEYDQLMYLPFHKQNNGHLPRCPNCNHKLMREFSYFNEIDEKFDCDYSCSQCRFDHLNYKSSCFNHEHNNIRCDHCDIKSLTNDDDVIVRRKEFIKRLHETIL